MPRSPRFSQRSATNPLFSDKLNREIVQLEDDFQLEDGHMPQECEEEQPTLRPSVDIQPDPERKLSLHEALDDVSLHDASEISNAAHLAGWHAVSTAHSGGVIAYFADEGMAAFFRLMLVAHICNPTALNTAIGKED